MDLALVQERWALLLDGDQQSFIQAYLVTQNLKAAAEMAGIKLSLARRYLASPTIQVAIKSAQQQLRDNAHVDPEEIIMDLRLVRDMALGRIPVPETKWYDGVPVTHYVRQFNHGAANKAIENLGRVLGMFTDRKEISVPTNDRQLQRRLEDLLGVSLDITDADVTDVTHTEASAKPSEASLLPTNEPESVKEWFEDIQVDELTALLAEACGENGV